MTGTFLRDITPGKLRVPVAYGGSVTLQNNLCIYLQFSCSGTIIKHPSFTSKRHEISSLKDLVDDGF